MNESIKEGIIGSEGLIHLAKKRFSFPEMTIADLARILDREATSGRLNKTGRNFLEDCQDLLFLRNRAPENKVAHSLEEARDFIVELKNLSGHIGYLTGGLEGLHLHHYLEGVTIPDGGLRTMILGLEEDSYIRAKGRKPLFSTGEKVRLWEQFAPDGSVVFVIPRKPETVSADDYYDWITQYLGLFRDEKIVYLGDKDDPRGIIFSRQRRAASEKHILNFSLGSPPLHVSGFLIKDPSELTEREKGMIGQEGQPRLYSFVLTAREDKLKIKGMIRKWQDKEIGHLDDNSRPIITLYAGEKQDHEPVAFIAEENEVLKVVVVGRTPELAEKHRQTIEEIVNC